MKTLPLLVLLAALGVAHADEGKNESGKGRPSAERWERSADKGEHRDDRKGERKSEHKGDRRDGRGHDDARHGHGDRHAGSYFHRHGHTRIPNGHLPPPGECRIWYPDRPPGHQPPPFPCAEGRRRVEPGGWLITPGPRPQEVEVAVYDVRRPGIVVDVGIFDARTGAIIRVVGAK